MNSIYQSPFLIALGWTIAASIWQSALLWLFYQAICSMHRHISPARKHFIAFLLLLGSFGWFSITLANKYSETIKLNEYLSGLDINTAIQTHSTDILFSHSGLTDLANQYLPYISAAYLIVLLLLSVKLINAYLHSKQLKTKGLLQIDEHWINLVNKYARKIGIVKKVNIHLSRYISVPATLNFFKPVILLPLAAFNHLTPQQVESIILHELAHIKRNDYLINIMASVIETILFFNPFVHLLGKSLKKEREHCCDDFVLQHRFDPHSYASALLSLEQMRVSLQPMAIAATGDNRQLLGRIKRIMDINTAPFNYGQRLLALVLMTFVMISVAWLSPQAGNNTKTFPDKIYSNNSNAETPLITDALAILPGHTTPQPVAPEKKVEVPSEKMLSGSNRKNSGIHIPAFSGMVPIPPSDQSEMPLKHDAPLPPSPPQLLLNENAEVGSLVDIFSVPVPPTVFFGGHPFIFKQDQQIIDTETGLSWWKQKEEDMVSDQMSKALAIDDLIKQINTSRLEAMLFNNQYSQLLDQEQLNALMNKALKKQQLQLERIARKRKPLSHANSERTDTRHVDKDPVAHNIELSLFNSLAEDFSSAGKMFSEAKMRLDSLKKASAELAEKQREEWQRKARKRNEGGENEAHTIYQFIVHIDNTTPLLSAVAGSVKRNIPVTFYTQKTSEEKRTAKEAFSYGNISPFTITTSADNKIENAEHGSRTMNAHRKKMVITL